MTHSRHPFWQWLLLLLPLQAPLLAQELSRTVEERGIPVRLTGVSEGNFPTVEEVVREQINLTRDTAPNPPLADDLAFFVETLYQQLGYPRAEVDWTLPGDAVGLQVQEGPSAVVGEITFTGQHSLDTTELTDHLLRPTRELRTGKRVETPFIEGKLEEGRTVVQRYCQSLGYLDAVVSDPVFTEREGGLVWDVTLDLKPGKQYHFGTLTLSGDFVGKQDEAQELIEGQRGLPFNEVKVESLRQDMTKVLQEEGYFYATVVAKYDLSRARDGLAPVEFTAQPGIRYRVTAIEVSPTFSAGAQRLIRGSLSEAIGEFYVPGEIEIMHRRSMDTEVFSRLDLDPVTSEDGTMTLKLSGTEAQRGRLSVYGGFESFNGYIIGFESRRVNIYDTGTAAQIEAELNARGWSYTLKWIDPAFFNTPNVFDVAFSHYTEEFFDIMDTAMGLRATLRRQFNRHLNVSAFAEVSGHEVTSEVFGDLFELFIGPLDYNVAMGGGELALDFRDSPVLPRKGWLMSLGVKGGSGFGGSDVSFVQVDTSFAGYVPITRKFRSAFRARSSVIYNSGGVRNLPFDLRLFNGGANSVRSFPEQELGLTLETIGGVQTDTFNVELSYEMAPNLELAIFGDAGSLAQETKSPFSSHEDLRYAAGLGVRYKLPFGPLRVDYGVNLDRQEGEDFGALHITFGFAF